LDKKPSPKKTRGTTGKKTRTKAKPTATSGSQALLSKVPVEFVFWCNNGCVFSDMQELANGLETMTDETYSFHMNPERQDFANWVRDIIKDKSLASDLLQAANRAQAAGFTTARIADLTGNQ
jgi:hypothetical protein